jgi:hypothetical protein
MDKTSKYYVTLGGLGPDTWTLTIWTSNGRGKFTGPYIQFPIHGDYPTAKAIFAIETKKNLAQIKPATASLDELIDKVYSAK